MSTTTTVSQQTIDLVVRDLMHEADGRPRNAPHGFVKCPYCARENSAAMVWVRGAFLTGRPPLQALPGQRCRQCKGSLDACAARDVIQRAS